MKVIGIDFGTTNSLISTIEGNIPRSFLDRFSKLPHPSIVCYQGSQIIVGRLAKERLSNAGIGVIGNIVRSPKTLLGKNKVYVEGVARSPKDMVAEIIKYVKADAEQQANSEQHESVDYTHAVVTIPVDMDGSRRKELREAFHIAGINITQFVHEPLAALYGHLRNKENFRDELEILNGELILVFDWGGGTLDLTLCKIVDGMLVQIMNDGCSDVGGDIIDDMILNEVVKKSLESRKIQSEMSIQLDSKQILLDQVERAKIALSNKDLTPIYVPNYFKEHQELDDLDIEYQLRRTELEKIIDIVIDKGIQRIHNLLDTANISPSSVALCLATGGIVNMPIIKSRLREIFGPQRLNISDRSNTIISEGAAWIAHDKANLTLAKNIELLQARNTYFPILKAGSQMPREGDVLTSQLSLYCTDPRDGIAKIEISSPKKPGRNVQKTDQRDTLGSISVAIDKTLPLFTERVELNVDIDDNLILTASAKSLIKNDADTVEIHNLEFGLDIKKNTSNSEHYDEFTITQTDQSDEANGISLLSNVVAHDESENIPLDRVKPYFDKLVPGEYMKEYNRYYFSNEHGVPQIQKLEASYYQPCSICKRKFNDPLCKCASSLRN